MDVGTKCPHVTDTYIVLAKVNNKVVPVYTIKAHRWNRGIYPQILKLGTRMTGESNLCYYDACCVNSTTQTGVINLELRYSFTYWGRDDVTPGS
jgi:hypothetical protein